MRNLWTAIVEMVVNRLAMPPLSNRLAARMSTNPYVYRKEFCMKSHKHIVLLASLLGMLAAAPAEYG
jgi:hypothetical protein